MRNKEPKWKKGFKVEEDADVIEAALPHLKEFCAWSTYRWGIGSTLNLSGPFVGILPFLSVFYRVRVDHYNGLGSAEYVVFRYSSLGREIARAVRHLQD